ncbi:hypothetical protein BDV93DRAFT_611717 [Ceratobasidium sp. AG-I]|nr:hypothetical protein BDV93DRAFT_611717 [Ceratobasidium sp. AG-I]
MSTLSENSYFEELLFNYTMQKHYLPKQDYSAQDVESAIQNLISDDSNNLSTSIFEAILDVVYYPEKLGLLVNPQVTPALFEILRQCPKDCSAFNFTIGCLLYQCLALATSVGLLAQNGKLERFIKSTDSSARQDRTDVSPLMTTWIMDMINEDVSVPHVMLTNIKIRLGWVAADEETLCLLAIGGHSFLSSLHLMVHGFRGRDGALTAYKFMPTLGWPALLLVMWAQIRSTEVDETPLFMSRLGEVVLRYCLLSAPNERYVMQALVDDCSNFIQPGEKYPPLLNSFNVFGMDAINVKTALVEQLSFRQTDSTSAQLRYITCLTDYALQVLGKLENSVLEAAFDRLWHEITCNAESLDRDFSDHVLLFATLLLQAVDKHFPQPGYFEHAFGPREVQAMVSNLVKADIISAFGRLLLLPPETIASDTNPASRSAMILEEALRGMSSLAKYLSQRHDIVRPAFSEGYPDWLKTFNYMFQLRSIQTRHDYSLYLRTKECMNTWAQLGQALGYLDYIRRTPCRYPRCAGGVESSGGFMACDICSEAIYCSARCQQADWESDLAPHGDICGEDVE